MDHTLKILDNFRHKIRSKNQAKSKISESFDTVITVSNELDSHTELTYGGEAKTWVCCRSRYRQMSLEAEISPDHLRPG